MALSGTYAWDLDNTGVIEEAYELAGWEARTAQDAVTARRSMNLIFRDWANWGVNLWTLEQITTDMVADTASYTLTARTLDVLTAIMRITSTDPDLDIPMERISIEEYHDLPDKTTTGRPNLYALVRGQSTPTLYVYPTPDDSTLDFVAWQIRYMQDVGTAQQSPDVPQRFLPALIYRLAYELARKKRVNATDPEMRKADSQDRQELRQMARELFEKAREEDSDSASLIIRPRVR
jgi:hypothetical protein